ncbi:MAG: SCO family protein [Luteitalea sp.]|nr:SCO family protein [Luteitalea sp.]
MIPGVVIAAAPFIAALFIAAPASGQMTGAPTPGYRQAPGLPASSMPAPLREIGFDQHLDQPLPLDAAFRDEQGRTVRIGEYFGARPVVLAFVYYQCPMLCTQVLSSITSTLGVMNLDAGKDFELVMVSFDPRETPAQASDKKAEYLARYQRPGAEAGWHFLTGDQESIARLTKAAGFRYVWDEPTKQFAHPTGVIVVTPDGRPARYLFGIEYGPRDLRLAIVEASSGAIGSLVDELLLFCYHYNPETGRYGLVIMRTLRIAGVATVLAIGAFVAVMVRRERRTTAAAADPSAHRIP